MRRLSLIIPFVFLCFAVYGQKVHTVKQGETIESIASLYHVSISDLKRENESTEILFPGLLLTIPKKEKDSLPQQPEQQDAPKLDKVEMKDGSYIICKVVSIRKTTILIAQEETEGNISIPIKDIIEIFYANGNKKKFGKR